MASATFTATFTTAGTYTWVAPTGVTSVSVQCWGGGGSGAGTNGNGNGGAAGGGGEYAAELSNTCVAGDSYTVVVGAAGAGVSGGNGSSGGNSTFSGTSATTVTAHGGSNGSGTSSGGSGGTGSSNSTHFNGGAGGVGGTSAAAGGGGGSGGTASAGNTGGNGSGSTGGSGGSAVTGGGPGGNGPNRPGSAGTNGAAPASGPGGGGSGASEASSGGSITTGGNGFAGQVIIIWTMSSPATIPHNTSGATAQWTAPSGVSTVEAQCWGGGGGGGGNQRGGGGGGEFAQETSLAVTASSSYTFVVGTGGAANTAGGNTTFAGNSVTVTAHGGSTAATTTGGAGGTGSTNTTHFNGGAGGSTTGTGGGGGGGGAGTGSAGNTGGSTSTSSGGSGASAVTGGGPGGAGGASGVTGSTPASGPAGGGGGDGAGATGGAVGYDGQLTLTWSNTVTSTGSIALAPMAMSGTVSVPFTSTGSMALAPMAMSATANNGVIPSTGSMALAPMAMQATDIEVYSATVSAALAPMAMSGTVYQAFPFPQGVLNALFEILVGGVWTDITDYVYQRQNVVIVRGRGDESSTGISNPASCSFVLNNRDGRFSPRNPTGPYYGLIGRNTQFRVSAQNAPLTPDLVYRFWGEISEWPPTWDNTGQDISVTIAASGILRRLNQNAPLRSALFRYYATLGTAPLAWWPAEDGSTATSIASGLPTGFAMTWTGTPTLASDSGLSAAAAFPAMNGAIFTGPTGVAGALPVANTAVFTSSGTWQAPSGVTAILTQCWGAGGGGSEYNGSTGGAGGGGGEYASDTLDVTPGTNYSYTVGTSSVQGNGGNTVMHGNSSTTVTAHGGGAGSSDGTTGGTGGTGSTNAVAFAGGAGASGSGGPGGSGSETQNNQSFTSSGTWDCPSDYVSGSLQAYVYGAGGGGGAGGSSQGGGGGGGGGFSQGSPSVSAGSNYSVTVGVGGSGGTGSTSATDGGASKFNGGTTANGGTHGSSGGVKGTGGSGNTYNGGDGASGDGNKGAGGGGGAGAGSGGTKGTDSNGGGAGGSGGASSGSLNGGGQGGDGGTAGSGNQGGNDGDPTGGGGGGGYTDQFGANDSGGNGGRGKVILYWDESSGSPTAAVGGGGGSSGGSSSVGNAGATEAGGAAVAGGGPGGGTLAGSSFNAAPTSTPGGGGGGYDSLGNAAAGAQGLISISWAASGGGSSTTTANIMRFVLHVPSGGDTDGAEVARMYTTGTIDYISVIYNALEQIVLGATTVAASNPNPCAVAVTVAGGTVSEIQVNGTNTGLTSGTFTVPVSGTITLTYSVAPTTFTTAAITNAGYLTLSGFTGAGAQLFTTGKVNMACNGVYMMVSAELTTSGSNINYALYGLIAGETSTVASATGTLNTATMGDPFDVLMNPGGTLTGTTWCHLALQESGYDTIDNLAGPLAAYAGETAAERFARVCTEQNIPYTFIDASGYTDSTALVGPQLPVTVAQLLQDCEDADRGLLYEPCGSFGVAYRSRYSLYAQSPAIQMNYGVAELAYPLQPTDDDTLTRNDVTMSRPNGSSYEYQVTTGDLSIQDPPNGVGSYTYSQSPNVDADSQLADLASWVAWIGTQDELRYPQINLDLSRQEIAADFTSVTAMDIGDHVQVVNTSSSPLPPGNIDQLLYGYTETLNAFMWTIACNCVPETPYEIAICDDGSGDYARADTDGSQLHSGIGVGDTSFYVDIPSPNAVWIDSGTYPDWFPFNITVAGEQMSVTAITGTSTPQLFTVTRAENGVQKAHNAGEAVNLSNPAIAAL